MKRLRSVAGLILLLIIAASLALLTACSKSDKIFKVADDDPEMAAAITKARSTLRNSGRPSRSETTVRPSFH
jgi:uncharacterized lipoprotein YajG